MTLEIHQFSKKSDQCSGSPAESPPNPLYLTLTLAQRNFNHPVGCFPSSTQKPKKSRSGPPGVFHVTPRAPQISKMVLQGAKRCLKVPSRHLKSPFWAHQIAAASSQPSTYKMKAASIKSQVGGPAAEAKPVDKTLGSAPSYIIFLFRV